MIKRSPWGVGPSILMYHSVLEHTDDLFSVYVDDFRNQIDWLVSNDFEIIALESLIRALQVRDYTKLHKKVVITFDDGYGDFVTNALPVLLEYGATATVYLVTGMLGGKGEWNNINGDCAPIMTMDEARYIKGKGISLGSHTSTHVDLTSVDDKELRHQLSRSCDVLTQLGESFCTFSYPWGRWTQHAAEAVKSAGYECALAVGESTRINPGNLYCLPRVTMMRNMDDFQMLMSRTSFEKETRRKFWMLRRVISKVRA